MELVDELIDYVPKPLVRQVQLNWIIGAKDKVEQLTVVEEGLESLVSGDVLAPSVNVAKVQILVENDEGVVTRIIGIEVDESFHLVFIRPRNVLVVSLSNLVEGIFIQILNFVDTSVSNCLSQHDDELSNLVWHLGGHKQRALRLIIYIVVVVEVILRRDGQLFDLLKNSCLYLPHHQNRGSSLLIARNRVCFRSKVAMNTGESDARE